MDNIRKTIVSGFAILLLMVCVSSESFVWIQIQNQIGEGELSEFVFVYQNNNLSRRFIKEQNYTDRTIRLNGGVDYDLYIPANPQHIVKNIEHRNWGNFAFYGFWVMAFILLIVIVIILLLSPFIRKLIK